MSAMTVPTCWKRLLGRLMKRVQLAWAFVIQRRVTCHMFGLLVTLGSVTAVRCLWIPAA